MHQEAGASNTGFPSWSLGTSQGVEMTTRIVIYGGTDLPPEFQHFVRCITKNFITYQDVIIISGGFECFEGDPKKISVDLAVLLESKNCISNAEYFNKRFETWLPAKKLDRPSEKVKRFEEGKVCRIPGTDQARRFKLVKAADGLVTIMGHGNTRTVLELALALEKPVLPIAFTGGDSETVWTNYRQDIIHTLNLQPDLINHLETKTTEFSELESIAKDVSQIIYEAAKKRCLVLMPFGPLHDDFYKKVLDKAIKNANHIPHRIDIDEYAGNIPSLFLSALELARSVVVDLTGLNPNVMYELGQVHARGINPFLIERRQSSTIETNAMPFYLRHEQVASEQDNESGHNRIAARLTQYLIAVTKNEVEQRYR